jgi:hypothetical protein
MKSHVCCSATDVDSIADTAHIVLQICTSVRTTACSTGWSPTTQLPDLFLKWRF